MATSSPVPQNAVEVFFSYAHVDEGLRNELAKHLSLIERQGIIAGWHDRRRPRSWDRPLSATPDN
jgi:hypothetical protein